MNNQSPPPQGDATAAAGVQEELLTKVLELIPFSVFWKDHESRYLGCNQAFTALAGLSRPAEIVGLTDYDLPWTRDESDAYREDDRQVIETGKAKLHIIETQLNADGERTWLDTSKVPLRDGQNRIMGVLGIFADITRRKENELELERTRRHLDAALKAMDSGLSLDDREERLEKCSATVLGAQPESGEADDPELDAAARELRHAKERAESASRTKSIFLANMSHEMRTPMSAILGFTNLLLEEATDDSMRESLEAIQRNSESLLELINDILDLSRVENDAVVAQREPVNLAMLIEEVLVLLRPGAAEKSIDLRLCGMDEVPEVVETDRLRLRQILINLVGNAIKFTHEGEVAVQPSWTQAGGGTLTVEVRDTGVGMTSEQLERIFRPFEQADGSTTRKYGGTGLGLAITRRLTELLGGKVEATSSVAEGSVFTATIAAPVLRRAGTPPVAPRADVQEGRSSAAPRKPNLEGLRILVAEDGRDNQRLIERLLTRAGASVELASDGAEALVSMERHRERGDIVDMILMDMQMPRVDGYEATRTLRGRGYEQPIVAVTANAMSGDREACLAAGCTDYVSKPLDFRGLLDLCATLGQPAG